ncbi:carbohydrate-binding module family 14 protein [Marimonas arenosa]|uniref:Carbohydrate-binding module family 14 protein n=1 Tax=Marimonas arenosa TaxID=1795305 RepID=A0AAE3WCG5_9RHOB|nr:carbohydrate-binding module family 14 protein [Marimonas arenosa]MDQ2089083.1 carbohydrate-binding module family 14 protein [Marimonas arenosa]
MKTKLAVLMLSLAPSLAMACPAKEQQAMSCAEGTVYDDATGSCVPQASS